MKQIKKYKLKRLLIILLLFFVCNWIIAQTDSTKNLNSISLDSIEFDYTKHLGLIIALISLLFSICFTKEQIELQRTHNKKSVKPIGRIKMGDYEDNIYIKIENCGVGPLIVRQILCKRNAISTSNSFIDILPVDLTKRIIWANFTSSYEGLSIIPGQMLTLIDWKINDTYQNIDDYTEREERIIQDRDELRKVLKDVSVSIRYTDIYEEEEFIDERTQEEFNQWYGRHEK